MYLWSFTVTTVTGSHKSFACALYEVTLDVTGACTHGCEPIFDRLAMQRQTTTRATPTQRFTGQRGASVSISVGYISSFAEQPNKVFQTPWICCLRRSLTVRFAHIVRRTISYTKTLQAALPVRSCSFLFVAVRCVFVLEIVLKACKYAEYCACSFCSAKNRDTP